MQRINVSFSHPAPHRLLHPGSGAVALTKWPPWQHVCIAVCVWSLSHLCICVQPVLVASAVGEGTAGWVGTGHTPSRTKYESRQERGLPSSVSQVGEDRRQTGPGSGAPDMGTGLGLNKFRC